MSLFCLIGILIYVIFFKLKSSCKKYTKENFIFIFLKAKKNLLDIKYRFKSFEFNEKKI